MIFAHWKLTEGKQVKTAKSRILETDLEFITKYALWREEIAEWNGDNQSPGMFAYYKDHCMAYVHFLLHSVMEKETGLSLLPSYTYFRVYRNGAILDPHKDRPACEVSASLLIGTNMEKPWPLIIEDEKILQEVGDILIYRGCEVEHWRDPLVTEERNYYVQLFAHYVDANGPYQMHANDQENGSIE